jgi:peptidoglycan-N-acetylglucosamine deacetylase
MFFFFKKKTDNFFFILLLISIIIFSFFLIQFLIPRFSHTPKIFKPTKFSPHETYRVIPFISQLSHGSRDLPFITLTFDADMSPEMLTELEMGKVEYWYDSKIIEILENKHIPVTIFMSGLWVETYPEIAISLANNPLFEIGNHSYSHPRFTSQCTALEKIPKWGKEGEYIKSQETIKKITGITPQYFRYPGGCRSFLDIKQANQHQLTVVDWDVASGDSFNDNRSAIINTVKTQTKNGSIILFHLNGNKNSPLTSDVLPELIDYLSAKGFIFVNLTDLLFSSEKVE